MKLHIVGGGPGGLYLGLLAKKQNPANRVTVLEQNPAGATYGWGSPSPARRNVAASHSTMNVRR